MNIALHRNVGSRLHGLLMFNTQTFTAGGATDNSEQTGVSFDRQDFVSLNLSGKMFFAVQVSGLGGSDTVTVSVKLQHSEDDNDWEDYDTNIDGDAIEDTVIDEDGNELIQVNVDLAGAKRYLRWAVTCNFDAGSTDTAIVTGIFAAGGFDELPVELSEGSS